MESQVQQINYSKDPNKIEEVTPKQSYSRSDLEALRFVNLNNQKLRWKSVYQTLDSIIAERFDGLRAPNHQKNKRKQRKKKSSNLKETPQMKLAAVPENINGNFTKKINSSVYSRNEMEELRYMDTEEQERKWNDVYNELSSDIVKEFDDLFVCTNQAQQSTQTKKINGKKCDSFMSKVLCTKDEDYRDFEEPFDEYVDDINNDDSSSGDEYVGLQRPAFHVEGEPDFDSGPPEDGLEYLRRVRWEAARIPKVKVVKPSSILASEQTPYMPIIPDIPTCPPSLLPSKDWEESFLANFSELRQKIIMVESSRSELQASDKQMDNIEVLKKNPPTLSVILTMDAVRRTTSLKKYIASVENAANLSRDDCLWLFSLCAALDTPLHADTSASLRSLLRKCSSLIAFKTERDDEVAMLTVIVAIAGKFFGQSQNIHSETKS